MLDKYEQPIYPFDLYVGINENLEEILSNFIDFDGNDTNRTTNSIWDNADGVVYYEILNKDTNANAYLVAFPKAPDVPLVAHEAFHVLFRLNEFIKETTWGNEASAYLLEWIVKCIMTTTNKYKNDTHLENN